MKEEKHLMDNEISTGELIDSPKFQKNSLLESLNSPEMVKMREDLAEAHQKSIEASVGWYHMLSEEDKYKAVEAFCYIICKAEREGTSHRGLMSVLGVYPEAFFIDDLMTIHNSLVVEYQEQDSRNWKDMKTLERYENT
jgi:Mlc titration factor MtfA (ptsG expression regulator)